MLYDNKWYNVVSKELNNNIIIYYGYIMLPM